MDFMLYQQFAFIWQGYLVHYVDNVPLNRYGKTGLRDLHSINLLQNFLKWGSKTIVTQDADRLQGSNLLESFLTHVVGFQLFFECLRWLFVKNQDGSEDAVALLLGKAEVEILRLTDLRLELHTRGKTEFANLPRWQRIVMPILTFRRIPVEYLCFQFSLHHISIPKAQQPIQASTCSYAVCQLLVSFRYVPIYRQVWIFASGVHVLLDLSCN